MYTQAEARRKVRAAIKRGDLVPEPCIECGEEKVDAHHEDYRKPLEVVWYCRKHHIHRHIQRGDHIQLMSRKQRGNAIVKRSRIKRQPWLPPKKVAGHLNLTTATITRWCRQGKFPNARKIGRVWRIPEGDIDQL